MFTPEFEFNDAKITFLLLQMIFSDLKLYSLPISAIFNKNKNFHVSKFSRPLIWKMTVATPLADGFC